MEKRERAQKLIEFINETEHEAESYSGRGMNGVECLSVNPQTSDSVQEFFGDLLNAALDLADDFNDALRNGKQVAHAMQTARTDNLSTGIVIYWPTLPFVEAD